MNPDIKYSKGGGFHTPQLCCGISFRRLLWGFMPVIFLMLFVTGCLFGQGAVPASVAGVTEKFVIETDRDVYFCGEGLFFSARYFINNSQDLPPVSTVVYVELIGCSDSKPVAQQKFPVSGYYVKGRITIPAGIATGNYMLRVYTQYQRNFPDDNFSYFLVSVLNPENVPNPLNYGLESDSIQIAAEGNMLLDGLKNKVVIWIPRPLLVDGNSYFITDNSGRAIETIKPSGSGFAQTERIFSASEEYSFLVVKNTGDSLFARFPEVMKTGIQTQIKEDGGFVRYSVQTRAGGQNEVASKFQLTVYSSRLAVQFKKDIVAGQSVVEANIPVEVLGEGINYFALSDATGQILKINSVYNSSAEVIKIDIKTDKTQFSTGEKVYAGISLNNPAAGEFPDVSVSVARFGTQKEDYPLMGGYLKNALLLGHYLLNSPGTETTMPEQMMVLFDAGLDKNKFAGNIIKTPDTLLKYIPEVRGLTVSGILRHKTTHEPVAAKRVYVSVLFNNPQLHVCKTRENGEFICALNNLEGVNDVFLCPEYRPGDENNYEILITNSFAPGVPEIGTVPVFAGFSDKKFVDELYADSQIRQYFNKRAEKETHRRDKSDEFNIDNFKTTTYLSDYVTLKNMEELFIEIMPKVSFKKVKGQYSIRIQTEYSVLSAEEPLILLDKIPVFDPNQIMQLDVSRIRKVEVIDKAYILGETVFQGVLMITTSTDNFAGIKIPDSGVFLEYQTTELSDNVSETGDFVGSPGIAPDFRTTLFWAPQVKLTPEGNKIEFTTSDRKGTYNIIVKGFTPDGKTFYGKKQIEVID